MKRLALTIMILAIAIIAWGEPIEAAKKDEKPKVSKCDKLPIYGELNDCLRCHITPSFKLKEEDANAWRDYPMNDMSILQDKDGLYGLYLFLEEVNHNFSGKRFLSFFQYLEKHNINRAIIEIQSFGGSVFEGWRIKGIITEYQDKGFEITTKVHSIAASAATIIFLSANNRLISPTGELMFHELWTFKFLAIESPADKEDEARVLRHIQDTITEWVASRSNMTKEEVDRATRKKEFWLRGTEALEKGFATGFISK